MNAPELARWEGVAIRYPFAEADAVGPVDLRLAPGERVLLLGPSGSGKSSLMLALTGLIPQSVPATVTGNIVLEGQPVAARTPAQWASSVAQYFQNADETLCGMRVEDEIAFALENQALAPDAIAQRIGEVMEALGLPQAWRGRRSASMSGGERQLVALAAVVAQGAPVLIADEPTSHLAPQAAARIHRLLAERDRFDAVLVIDHRLDGLIEAIDRVVVIGADGHVLADRPPAALFRGEGAALKAAGIWRPAVNELDDMLAGVGLAAEAPPLSFDAALAHLEPGTAHLSAIAAARVVVERYIARRVAGPRPAGDVVAQLNGVACAPLMGKPVLSGIDLEVRAGEVLGIIGPNGAGKTTLAATLAGLLRPKAGLRIGAPGGFGFQTPEAQLVGASVRDEIEKALPAGANADAVLERWGFAELAGRHPFELSQGQKRRLALATLDAADRWPLIVLDEPFAGLDASGAEMLAEHILALRDKGKAVAVITHDMDLAAMLCSRLVVVADGGIAAEGAPLAVLGDAALLERAGLAEPGFAPALRWLERVDAAGLAKAG